jgi:hypothetical protein
VTTDVALGLMGAVLLALALYLAFRLIRRDSGIRVTRLGVFVERERFHDVHDVMEGQEGDETKEWPLGGG